MRWLLPTRRVECHGIVDRYFEGNNSTSLCRSTSTSLKSFFVKLFFSAPDVELEAPEFPRIIEWRLASWMQLAGRFI